jgi:hypothetical protein
MATGRPNPVEIVIGEDDTEDPQGDLDPRHSQFLTAECDGPSQSSQNGESAQTSSVVPKKPAAWVVLMQAQDLGSHHRNEGSHEPNWGGYRLHEISRRLRCHEATGDRRRCGARARLRGMTDR